MSKQVVECDAGTLVVPITDTKRVITVSPGDSPLSPWGQVVLDLGEHRFNSVAQAMLWHRAEHIGDRRSALAIESAADTRTLMEIARRLTHPHDDWLKMRDQALDGVLLEMVLQNHHVLVGLLSTAPGNLAYASAADADLGVGLRPDHPDINVPSRWPGRNRYGLRLQAVRDVYCRELLPLFIPPSEYRAIDAEAVQEVLRLVEACFSYAEDLYDREFPRPKVRIDLQGTCAGKAYWMSHGGDTEIRFNPVLLSENWQAFQYRTVPHEVAHLVVRHTYGAAVRSHGAEWQAVMRDFGCEVTRCHSYSTANSAKAAGQRVVTGCKCRIHLVASKRLRQGARCRVCSGQLREIMTEANLILARDEWRKKTFH